MICSYSRFSSASDPKAISIVPPCARRRMRTFVPSAKRRRSSAARVCTSFGGAGFAILGAAGAAIRFDGQIAVFDLRAATSPCYACLFPEDGENEDVRCAVMGVFAPLTGIVGSIQAAAQTAGTSTRQGRPKTSRGPQAA